MANPDKIIKKKNIPVFFEKFGRNYHLLSQNIRTILAGTSLLGHTVIYYFICPTKEMQEEWRGVHASPLPDFGRSVTLSKPEGQIMPPHITTPPSRLSGLPKSLPTPLLFSDPPYFGFALAFPVPPIIVRLFNCNKTFAINFIAIEYVPRGLNTSNGKI